jgi:YD repeat-containing protein
MGRLTKVLEDPNDVNYETDYTYNPLDKLTQVAQAGSHTRTFAYDSLGRMTSGLNPETGTISYNYDSDTNCPSPNSFLGLLVSHVDARGTRTCMQYDQDNRMTYKSHSDGTLYDYFEYDITTTGVWVISNGIGRLTLTVAGQNATHLMSYDSMGRVLLNSQGAYWDIPNNNGQTNSAYNVNYTYDLAGDVKSVSSGVGGTTNNNGIYASYLYDNALRPISLTSSQVDGNHPATLATVQNHWPTGAIQKMTYGNGLTGTRAYDNRLQPCRVNVNSSATALTSCTGAIPSGNVMDLNAGFNYGSSDNVSVFNANGSEWEANLATV